MKGLLIKDFRIIMNQKRFIILYLFVALILSFSMDSTFIVSYVPMVATLLILSTISYDYNDNGLSFIMTLPNRPGDYAVAKYIFSIIGVTVMWAFSIVLQFVSFIIQKKSFALSEVLMTDAMMLPLFLLIASIMIPIELKYSPERGRVVMFGIFGVVMVIAIAGKSLLNAIGNGTGFDVASFAAKLQSIPGAVAVIAVYAVCIVLMSISMVGSIMIMQNKEF